MYARALLALSLLTAGPALAQEVEPVQAETFRGGVALLAGPGLDFGDEPEELRLELRGDFVLLATDYLDLAAVLPVALSVVTDTDLRVDTERNLVEVAPSLRATLLPREWVRPYFELGTGAAFRSVEMRVFDEQVEQSILWATRGTAGVSLLDPNAGFEILLEPAGAHVYAGADQFAFRYSAMVGVRTRI